MNFPKATFAFLMHSRCHASDLFFFWCFLSLSIYWPLVQTCCSKKSPFLCRADQVAVRNTQHAVTHDQSFCQWPFTMEHIVICCLSTLASLKLYWLKGRKWASLKLEAGITVESRFTWRSTKNKVEAKGDLAVVNFVFAKGLLKLYQH